MFYKQIFANLQVVNENIFVVIAKLKKKCLPLQSVVNRSVAFSREKEESPDNRERPTI